MSDAENEHVVAQTTDLDDGDRIVTEVRGREIGVFRVDGEYYAYPNYCPHQNGPLCEGEVSGTTAEQFDRDRLETDLEWVKEGQVLRCPWHDWEFDLVENGFLHDEDQTLPSYPVRVDDGDVIVSLSGRP